MDWPPSIQPIEGSRGEFTAQDPPDAGKRGSNSYYIRHWVRNGVGIKVLLLAATA